MVYIRREMKALVYFIIKACSALTHAPLVIGSPEKAVAHYQQAIKLSPSHDVAMVNLGRLYRSLGDNSMAEEWYKR